MASTPYMNSSQLIEAVKRKVAVPISQNTFSENDILAFLNEEMFISQVPSVLQYHEEYFVSSLSVPLKDYVSRYAIPDRSIGMKLRDLFWQDENKNLFEMSRINSEDKAYYQRNIGSNEAITKYYLEGNEIVLTPGVIAAPTGSLYFNFFLRPNQLVSINRAATIDTFTRTITIDNATLNSGDTITIDDTMFTATSGSPVGNEFLIGATSALTATNLITLLNTNGQFGEASVGITTNIVVLSYDDVTQTFSTPLGTTGMIVQSTQGIRFTSVPDNITADSLIDFLQTKPGHRIRAYDIEIPTGGIVGTTINFVADDVPSGLLTGDYICSANECIIPGIPPDLHSLLAERAAARILIAIGDQQGLANQKEAIKEAEYNQGMLLDNRVEGSILKVAPKKTLLRLGQMGFRRKF